MKNVNGLKIDIHLTIKCSDYAGKPLIDTRSRINFEEFTYSLDCLNKKIIFVSLLQKEKLVHIFSAGFLAKYTLSFSR